MYILLHTHVWLFLSLTLSLFRVSRISRETARLYMRARCFSVLLRTTSYTPRRRARHHHSAARKSARIETKLLMYKGSEVEGGRMGVGERGSGIGYKVHRAAGLRKCLHARTSCRVSESDARLFISLSLSFLLLSLSRPLFIFIFATRDVARTWADVSLVYVYICVCVHTANLKFRVVCKCFQGTNRSQIRRGPFVRAPSCRARVSLGPSWYRISSWISPLQRRRRRRVCPRRNICYRL